MWVRPSDKIFGVKRFVKAKGPVREEFKGKIIHEKTGVTNLCFPGTVD